MHQRYATAVLQLLNSGSDLDTVLRGLKQALAARGHEQLYVRILEVVSRTLAARGPQGPRLVLARAADADQLEADIKAALQKLGASNDTPVIDVDETIIGGFIAEHASQRIDASYKSKLVNLYRSVSQSNY